MNTHTNRHEAIYRKIITALGGHADEHDLDTLPPLLAHLPPNEITVYHVACTLLADHAAVDEISWSPLDPYAVTLMRADGETITPRLDTDNASEGEIRSFHSEILRWLEAADMSGEIDLATLARLVATALDITNDAAHDILDHYIDQLAHVTGDTIDPDEISDDDAVFLMEACREAQRSGDLGEHQLAHLEEIAHNYDTAHTAFQIAEQQRMAAVRAALVAGARVVDICRITGMTRSRVYQIRDEA